LIVAIGNTIETVYEFLVVVDSLTIKTKSFTEALDICVKIVFVLSLKYQRESMHVWHFIQNFFYFALKQNGEAALLTKRLKALMKKQKKMIL
jgi:hypothetical protein